MSNAIDDLTQQLDNMAETIRELAGDLLVMATKVNTAYKQYAAYRTEVLEPSELEKVPEPSESAEEEIPRIHCPSCVVEKQMKSDICSVCGTDLR